MCYSVKHRFRVAKVRKFWGTAGVNTQGKGIKAIRLRFPKDKKVVIIYDLKP